MDNSLVKILYAEDNRMDRMAFEHHMKRYELPLACTLTASVRETKSALLENEFDIVITDYDLGDGTGFEVIDHVNGNTPVIFVTSMNDLSLAVEAMKRGAYDYLVKDLERNYLRILPHAIQKALAHRKVEKELQLSQQKLTESLKIKEQFLANISHEIRTPLNGIIGFIQLMEESRLSDEQKEYIRVIKTSGETLMVIINDILDFTRNKNGKIIFEKINFNLGELLANVSALLTTRVREKGLKYSCEMGSDVPAFVVGDPTRLTQVLLNLIGNSAKFTERGSIQLKVKKALQEQQQVILEFSVCDTGIGIPGEKLSTIFEEFMQASNDTTRKYGGSGLGLAIVKQLVEMQQGSISVQSAVGEGTTFSFQLAFGIGKADEAVPLTVNDIPRLDGTRVLVVEDNTVNQMLAEKHLLSWRCQVMLAENGREALQKLQEHEFDLVLMDLQLPEMDGYEAANWIRKNFHGPKSNIPIIAVTAHATAEDREKCLEAGMDAYVSKPFDWKKLRVMMATLLNEAKERSMEGEGGMALEGKSS